MRKNVFGRQFKRDANERKALFKNLLTSLVLHERIRTTEAKAKAIKGAADKLITKAKTKKGDQAYKQLHPDINQDAVVKVIDTLAPRFAKRQGGYTRIIKDRNRVADNAPMVYLEWTEREAVVVKDASASSAQGTATKEKKVKDASSGAQVTKQVVEKKAVKSAKQPVQKQTRSRTRSGL